MHKLWGWVVEHKGQGPCGLAHELAKFCYKQLGQEMGEVDLIITLIIKAAETMDDEWLLSESCQYYCEIIGLPHSSMLQCVMRVRKQLEGECH